MKPRTDHLREVRCDMEALQANLEVMEARLAMITAHPIRSSNATAERVRLNDLMLRSMVCLKYCQETLEAAARGAK